VPVYIENFGGDPMGDPPGPKWVPSLILIGLKKDPPSLLGANWSFWGTRFLAGQGRWVLQGQGWVLHGLCNFDIGDGWVLFGPWAGPILNSQHSALLGIMDHCSVHMHCFFGIVCNGRLLF
jgi:hypothetical protein